MEEDKELEKLKRKKLNEIMNKIEKQHDDKNPKTILKSKLIDRGEEVLDIAEKAYPNETKAVIKKLSELIKQGKIQNLISGGELLSIFRNLGLNFSVSTSISVSKDGKITSCRFTFTEWLDRIDFKKDPREVYDYWGISNSLHVISMAFDLVGMPKKLNAIQHGQLKWHKSGKIFVGSGISEQNIPFSYHADWGSGGRWAIEIMTKNYSYRLMPLEQLEMCPTGKTTWQSIKLDTCFDDVKQGVAEELSIMLSNNKKLDTILPSLEKASKLNKIAMKIFGYKINK